MVVKNELNVYIATLPRAGSTLLGMILGTHPEVFHVGESSYWGKINPKDTICSCGIKGCPILLRVYDQIAKNFEVESIYRACSIIDRIEEPNKQYHPLSLPDGKQKQGEFNQKDLETVLYSSCLGLECISRTFREMTGRRIIVDNTKSIRIAKKLLEYPRWKVILLLRDPRGMAYSNKKSGQRKGVSRPVSSKISVYKDFAKRALGLLKKSTLVHFLKYEEICQDTSGAIRKVCEFLEIEYMQSMLEFKKDKGHTLMGNRMRLDDNQEIKEDLEWKVGLTKEEKTMLCGDEELVSLFSQFGYEISLWEK